MEINKGILDLEHGSRGHFSSKLEIVQTYKRLHPVQRAENGRTRWDMSDLAVTPIPLENTILYLVITLIKWKKTTFVAVPRIKEINTSKFSRVYYLEGLPGIVNSLPGKAECMSTQK